MLRNSPRPSSLAIATLAVAIGALTAPALAVGTTYCVQKPSCVAGGGTSSPGLQQALDSARDNFGSDRVEVGPGSFIGPFQYVTPTPNNALELVGSGSGATSLKAGASQTVLRFQPDAPSLVADLNVEVPPGDQAWGIRSVFTTVRGVDVTATAPGPGTPTRRGVSLNHGSFEQGSVELGTSQDDRAIVAGQLSTVRDAELRGFYGINAFNQLRVERVTVQASLIGIYNIEAFSTLEDVVIRLTTPAALSGVEVPTSSDLSATLDARHLTIYGSAGTTTAGVQAFSGFADRTSNVAVRNSIIRNVPKALAAETNDAAAKADVTASYSDYNPAGNTTSGPGAEQINQANNLNVDPLFVNPAGGDLRLLTGSPVINQGEPVGLVGGESATDLDGNRRISGGRRDMGAFEFQFPPQAGPVIGGTPTTDGAAAQVGTGTGSTTGPTALGSPAQGLRNCPRRATVASDGRVRLCDATNPPTVSTTQVLSASLPGGASASARRRKRRRRVGVGRAATAIPPGATRPVVVRLSRSGRRALRSRRRLGVVATITARGPTGTTATVKRTITLRPRKLRRRRR